MKKDLELSVTLNTDLPGHCYLVVNNGDHVHEFDEHPEDQGISWTLTGNASHGEFCALDGPSPGFQWSFNKPRDGIFRSLSAPTHNKLSMLNHHTGKDTRGRWQYQLFARFGDRVYQTPQVATNGPSDTSSPTIKNT